MLSETLSAELTRYAIGPKVKALRVKKKLGLAELGAHTGLSAAMLSKIERGHLFPTLPTLVRIALVFGVGLEHFFTGSDDGTSITVIRKRDRVRLPDRPGEGFPCYLFESLNFRTTDRNMEVYFAEFPTRSQPSEPHRHDGSELIYVIEGKLSVTIDEAQVALEKGDVLCFDSSVPHSYDRRGRSGCRVIVITGASA